MRTRSVGVLVVWIGAALVVGACGDSGGEALTRAGFVARGNEICEGTQKAIEEGADRAFPNKGLVPTADEVGTFFEDTLKPQLQKELDALGDLKPPKDDKGRVQDILEAGRDGLTEADNNPVIILNKDRSPLGEYGDLAGAYGLKFCGQNSDKTMRALAGLR